MKHPDEYGEERLDPNLQGKTRTLCEKLRQIHRMTDDAQIHKLLDEAHVTAKYMGRWLQWYAEARAKGK